LADLLPILLAFDRVSPVVVPVGKEKICICCEKAEWCKIGALFESRKRDSDSAGARKISEENSDVPFLV
jgi:hypothetical protein